MSPILRHLLRPPMDARRFGRGSPRGFTLVELLVVVGIIALLAALLIPSLARVKNNSRATQTQALLGQISGSIDSYYRTFNAYPGPIPTNPHNSVASTADTDDGTKCMSGAQNLLLGLSYAMAPQSATAYLPIPNSFLAPGVPAYTDPSRANGPINYAAPQPNGSYEQLTAYFTPASQQLSSPIPGASNAWPVAGIAITPPGNNFAFPVLVDTFPDAMPILYYRRSPGVNSPVVIPNNGATAAYYLAENQEYTNATSLTASDGTVTNQAANPLSAAAFQNIVQTADGSAARGGYLLMSAGVDRFYGSSNQAGIQTTDNQVVVGGN